MKEIVFPEFNLKFQINSIAIKIGNVSIYWYAIFIVFAILIALYLCKKDDGKYGIYFQTILKIFIITLPIAILVARLYYVIFKLDYYIKYPYKILKVSDGGLAIYGGILGGIIVIFLYCKKKKISVLDIFDYIAPYLALSQAIGRWGNFFNQEAYGIETKNIFRMGILENGKYIEVHPTFLYESIGNILIFILLFHISKNRKYKGQITYLYFMFYGIIRMIVESFRSDSLMIGEFKVSQIFSIIIAILFGSVIIWKFYYKKVIDI